MCKSLHTQYAEELLAQQIANVQALLDDTSPAVDVEAFLEAQNIRMNDWTQQHVA